MERIKASNLNLINTLMRDLTELRAKRIEAKLGVTFGGKYDDEMAKHIKPFVDQHLLALEAPLVQDLLNLGVAPDA